MICGAKENQYQFCISSSLLVSCCSAYVSLVAFLIWRLKIFSKHWHLVWVPQVRPGRFWAHFELSLKLILQITMSRLQITRLMLIMYNYVRGLYNVGVEKIIKKTWIMCISNYKDKLSINININYQYWFYREYFGEFIQTRTCFSIVL